MSGRRGRGKRGGGGQLSQSKQLLKRSAQEAGLDSDRQRLSMQDIVRPALFPDFRWLVAGGRQSYLIDDAVKEESNGDDDAKVIPVGHKPGSMYPSIIPKQRQLFQVWQQSPLHIQPLPEIDIARYGRPVMSTAPDQAVLLSLRSSVAMSSEAAKEDNGNTMNKLATDERYFPAELLSTQRQLQSAHKARNPSKKTLTALLEDESEPAEGEDYVEVEEEQIIDEEEDEDDVADYTRDYYNTDDESGSDEGEATF